jgi:glycosyltransferase involved in cell wall biosynthesis
LCICDDGSTDDTYKFLKKHDSIKIVKGDGNQWWTGGTNLAVQLALDNNADVVVTLNNDSTIESDFIEQVFKATTSNPGAIIAARLIIAETKSIWACGAFFYCYGACIYCHNFSRFPEFVLNDIYQDGFNVDCTPGNGVAYPSDVFRTLGLFNYNFFPHYHSDTHFSYLCRVNGFQIKCDPRVSLYTHIDEHKSSVSDINSIKSPNFLPAIYYTVLEHTDNESMAIESSMHSLVGSRDHVNLHSQIASYLNFSTSFTFNPNFVGSINDIRPVGYSTCDDLLISNYSYEPYLLYKFDGSGFLNLHFSSPISKLCSIMFLQDLSLFEENELPYPWVKVSEYNNSYGKMKLYLYRSHDDIKFEKDIATFRFDATQAIVGRLIYA